MVIDLAIIGICIRSVIEIDGIVVVIVSETLDGFGGGVIIVPKGIYDEDGGGNGYRGIYEVERSELIGLKEVLIIGDLPWHLEGVTSNGLTGSELIASASGPIVSLKSLEVLETLVGVW